MTLLPKKPSSFNEINPPQPIFQEKNLQSLHYTFHRRLLRPVAPSTPLPSLRPACAGAAAPDRRLPDDPRARSTGIPPRRAARAPPLGPGAEVHGGASPFPR
jgi:hypothetical protein